MLAARLRDEQLRLTEQVDHKLFTEAVDPAADVRTVVAFLRLRDGRKTSRVRRRLMKKELKIADNRDHRDSEKGLGVLQGDDWDTYERLYDKVQARVKLTSAESDEFHRLLATASAASESEDDVDPFEEEY